MVEILVDVSCFEIRESFWNIICFFVFGIFLLFYDILIIMVVEDVLFGSEIFIVVVSIVMVVLVFGLKIIVLWFF